MVLAVLGPIGNVIYFPTARVVIDADFGRFSTAGKMADRESCGVSAAPRGQTGRRTGGGNGC